MLTRPERYAALILIGTTIGLFLLYAGTVLFMPDGGAVPYTPETPDDTRVVLEGVITSSKITASGGHVLLNVSGVTVFVEGGAADIYYSTGNLVRVTGTAETYSGMREIVVGPTGSLQILA